MTIEKKLESERKFSLLLDGANIRTDYAIFDIDEIDARNALKESNGEGIFYLPSNHNGFKFALDFIRCGCEPVLVLPKKVKAQINDIRYRIEKNYLDKKLENGKPILPELTWQEYAPLGLKGFAYKRMSFQEYLDRRNYKFSHKLRPFISLLSHFCHTGKTLSDNGRPTSSLTLSLIL